MGIETEFGVLHADAERRSGGAASAIALSHLVVGAYALLDPDEGPRGHRVRWDYGDESPLRDARGFELQRAAAHPSQLTDEVDDSHVAGGHVPALDPMMSDLPSVDLDQPLVAPEIPPDGDDHAVLAWANGRSIGNAVLRNGARLYVDHAHPEYSSPEVLTAREGVVWDRAGERIAARAMAILEQADGVPSAVLYKNNSDGKGASYGTHENFLLDRAVPFDRVVEVLLPFFASRQVVVGAGRVGIGTRGQEPGFQISSRADFFEEEVGLETTLNRPLVNTRDEPHADPQRHRRLHVIIGDANMLEVSTFLKLGATSLVLAALEEEQRTGRRVLPVLHLEDPVRAVRDFSHDPSLCHAAPTREGGSLTAVQIQQAYADAITAHADAADPETAEVLDLWQGILRDLATEPMRAADRVEWLAKLSLLESYRTRGNLSWEDPRLQAIDLQFSDLRPQRSLFAKLRAAERVRTLVTDQEVDHARLTPPASTRAHLRGSLITAHRGRVTSAGWDAITLSDEQRGARLVLADPRLGSAGWCESHHVDPSAPTPDILAALAHAQAADPDPTVTPDPTIPGRTS
jgi:proteasome accessory factor A